MIVEVANALYRYFETLYNLNQNLIILCGVDVLDNRGQYEKHIEEVIQSIPRLVPYKYDVGNSDYAIISGDGLMEFSCEIPFLQEDYENILQCHKAFLEKAKKIRNKLEHKMHGARIVASFSSSSSFFSITYEVTGQEIDMKAFEMISFVKDMNSMFTKIQVLVDQFAFQEKQEDHPYYRRLIRYSFSEFNKIYESNLLRTFGKALLPF